MDGVNAVSVSVTMVIRGLIVNVLKELKCARQPMG